MVFFFGVAFFFGAFFGVAFFFAAVVVLVPLAFRASFFFCSVAFFAATVTFFLPTATVTFLLFLPLPATATGLAWGKQGRRDWGQRVAWIQLGELPIRRVIQFLDPVPS